MIIIYIFYMQIHSEYIIDLTFGVLPLGTVMD